MSQYVKQLVHMERLEFITGFKIIIDVRYPSGSLPTVPTADFYEFISIGWKRTASDAKNKGLLRVQSTS
jgi:hypothetical protein